MLYAAATYTALPHMKPIEMPYPHELSSNCKELLNFTSKVHSKLAGESTHYIDDQHKLCYIYGFLKGNAQNQIQPYLFPNKIKLKTVESLIVILKAAFGNPDEVGTTSTDLDKLTQGNKECSQYYVEFQHLMAILDYNSNAMKAALKCGLSQELQISLVYQAKEQQDFAKFVDLCMKLHNWVHAHTMTTKCQTTPVPPWTSPALPCPSTHLTSTNSGNYRATPIDLSVSQKAQNQRQCDEYMAKGLGLYCGSTDHFNNQCPALAANNSQNNRLAAAKISSALTTPAPPSEPSSGNE
jgi:hypothetical protein